MSLERGFVWVLGNAVCRYFMTIRRIRYSLTVQGEECYQGVQSV